MAHTALIGITLPTLLFFAVIVATLVSQVVLTLQAKTKFMPYLPGIILSGLTLIFAIGAMSITGWDALFYIVFAICSGSLTAACGFGHIIGSIIKSIQKKRTKTVD